MGCSETLLSIAVTGQTESSETAFLTVMGQDKSSCVDIPILRRAEAYIPTTSGGSAAVATGASSDTDSLETSLKAVTEASGNRESSEIVSVVGTEVTRESVLLLSEEVLLLSEEVLQPQGEKKQTLGQIQGLE